jgi:hypothetical protein
MSGGVETAMLMLHIGRFTTRLTDEVVWEKVGDLDDFVIPGKRMQ